MGKGRKSSKAEGSCAKGETKESASDHDLDVQLEATILSLLSSRRPGSSC